MSDNEVINMAETEKRKKYVALVIVLVTLSCAFGASYMRVMNYNSSYNYKPSDWGYRAPLESLESYIIVAGICTFLGYVIIEFLE